MKTLLEAMNNLKENNDKCIICNSNDLKGCYVIKGHNICNNCGSKYSLKEIMEYLGKYKNKVTENFVNDINDEEPPKILYHFTTFENLMKILDTNKILGQGNNQVSFTSDDSYPNNGFQPLERTTIMLAFDGEKMSKHYTIERYVYDLDDSAEYDDYVNEHEWIIEHNFNNVSEYLLYISNVRNMVPEKEMDQLKEKYPNIKIEEW